MDRICGTCFTQIDSDVDFTEHTILCKQEQMMALSQYFNTEEVVNEQVENRTIESKYPPVQLSKTQKKAIRFFRKKARLMSRSTRHLLLEKVIRLGYDEDDLDLLCDFISQAPVISFVPIYSFNLFENFDEDPRMKNLFEVGKGRGNMDQTIRAQWESSLFNGLYDDSEPVERVKYGVFNIDGNPEGVLSAKNYGDLYFVFDERVKKRTTMVFGDSSGNANNLHIATPDHFCNILHYLPDHVIESVILKAKGMDFNYMYYPYVEVQIHGEIRLDRDVKQIVASSKIVDQRLEDFCQRFGIDLIEIN